MSDEQTRLDPFDEGGRGLEGDTDPRRVITLLTDFGVSDHYVSVMKGVMIDINPNIQIIDITHTIRPFEIQEAAVILAAAYHYFPKGTIHVGVVDPGVGSDRRGILTVTENYYFVGPDNGIFSYALEDPAYLWTRELRTVDFFLDKVSSTFHGRDVFAPVAGYLSTGEAAEKFGPIVFDPIKLANVKADVDSQGTIWGEVIYVDHFGNLITNIETGAFWEGKLRAGGEENECMPVIEIGGNIIKGMSEHYQENPEGQIGAHFNSWSRLEIFVPAGNAAQAIQVEKGAPVSVRFEVSA